MLGDKLNFQILTNEQLDKIHLSAIKILENLGVKVTTKKALEIFSDAGADVNWEQKIVKIPSYLIKESIKKAPAAFTLMGRVAKVSISRGETYTRPSTGLVNILDAERGELRKANCKDVADVARIVDYLDSIHINATHLLPFDIPPEINDVYSFKIVLENTGKPIVVSPLALRNLEFMWRIATIIRNEEELKKNPLFGVLNCPLSPLILRDDISIFCAEKGIPTIINSAPVVGVSSPVTLAGTMVLQSAEALATLTLIQLSNPGSPIVWGCKSTPLDMRYGSPLSGVVEIGLLSAGAVQVAHYYNLPAEGFGPRTDSKVLDEQAGIERSFLSILPALAGAEIISGAGCLEAVATFNMEQLIIDNELYKMIFRILKGISIDEHRLAVDVIMRVGIGGNYLKDISTVKYYRSEFLIHELFDKRERASWMSSGSKRIEHVAAEKCKKILSEHVPPLMENEEKREIESIIKELVKEQIK